MSNDPEKDKCNLPLSILFKFGMIIDLDMLIPKKHYFSKSDNRGQNYEQLKITIFVIAQTEKFCDYFKLNFQL